MPSQQANVIPTKVNFLICGFPEIIAKKIVNMHCPSLSAPQNIILNQLR